MTTMEETSEIRDANWNGVAAASVEAEMRAAEAAMPPRRFDEMLPCRLTDEEVAAKADELEDALASVDVLKAEKKDRTAEINARIKIAEARVSEIREVRRTRTEMRDVECVESYELRLGVARTTRVDTGEQIRERALRSSELQPSLPLVDDGQMTLDAASHEEEPEPASDGDIVDPESVLDGDVEPKEEAKPTKVIRRRKKSS